MDKQQEICMKCGWCCTHDVFKADTKDLEVYATRGHDLIYDYRLNGWFVIIEQKCQYHDKICTIYDKRPHGCADWMCPAPDGSIQLHLNICRDMAKKMLPYITGERKKQNGPK